MNFVSIRIITGDVQRLVRFYERVTGLSATRYTEDFAELATPACILAIAGTRTLNFFVEGMARPGANQSVIIEFLVADVDKTYRGLADFAGHALVQEPTTMPWGNRSLLLRDPDGNLVNLFTPVTAEAIRRLGGQEAGLP